MQPLLVTHLFILISLSFQQPIYVYAVLVEKAKHFPARIKEVRLEPVCLLVGDARAHPS